MIISKDGSTDTLQGLQRLWDIKELPNPEYARDWQRILRSKPIKSTLENYTLFTKTLAEKGLDRTKVDISGVIILHGPPGTGKSTLARGFANHFSSVLGDAYLFTLKSQNIFSELLGQSAKQVANAFQAPRIAAEQGPTVMLVDEIESITFARNKVINSSDPSDLIRFVDRLLQEVDALQQFPSTVVVATTNFSEVIDHAFWDRADLALEVPLPDYQTRLAILEERARLFRLLGLALKKQDLREIATKGEGLSGRALGKLFSQTYLRKGPPFKKLAVSDVLDVIKGQRREHVSD